jgi:hypothetical protein
MVNEERLGLMIRMAKQDTPQQRKALKIANYYRNDYIALAMIGKFIQMTIGYVILLMFVGLASMDFLMDNLGRINYRILGAEVIIGYIPFVGIYLGITYIVWSVRYHNAKKTKRIYEENIRKIDKIYQREDRES